MTQIAEPSTVLILLHWLPKCNSMRTRPGWIQPEIYFRIVHAAQNGHKGAPVAAYLEQMVEIARKEGISRGRVTQVIGMLRLAPDDAQRRG